MSCENSYEYCNLFIKDCKVQYGIIRKTNYMEENYYEVRDYNI